jgi:hypothetical protein
MSPITEAAEHVRGVLRRQIPPNLDLMRALLIGWRYQELLENKKDKVAAADAPRVWRGRPWVALNSVEVRNKMLQHMAVVQHATFAKVEQPDNTCMFQEIQGGTTAASVLAALGSFNITRPGFLCVQTTTGQHAHQERSVLMGLPPEALDGYMRWGAYNLLHSPEAQIEPGVIYHEYAWSPQACQLLLSAEPLHWIYGFDMMRRWLGMSPLTVSLPVFCLMITVVLRRTDLHWCKSQQSIVTGSCGAG